MANDTKNAEKSTESDKEVFTVMDTKDKAEEVNKDALTTTAAAADTAVSKDCRRRRNGAMMTMLPSSWLVCKRIPIK